MWEGCAVEDVGTTRIVLLPICFKVVHAATGTEMNLWSENIKESLRTSSRGTRLESWLSKRCLPQWFPYTIYVDLFHLPTLMQNSLFIKNMYVTLQSSTCFEHQHAHLQEDKLYYRSIWYRHSLYSTVQYAGCCDNTICLPEDGHVDALNMSRIVM